MSERPQDFHEQVAALFEAVADLPAAAREAHFAQHKVSADVRAEVESLLGIDASPVFAEDQLGMVTPSLVTAVDGSSSDDWKPGRVVGDYRIEGEVARGGNGIVFAARQVSLDRLVALKVIRASHLANEAERQRFQVEAEAVARLDHPGIVPVYEVGTLEGLSFLSMGFVGGGSLAELNVPLGDRYAALVVRQVAEAVHYANSRNIVHRDLKPANVLLTDDDVPKVTDFGLAKKTDEDSDLTMTGSIMGTPGFMAPEQARGDNDLVGPLADVYGIGGILYFLLLGRPPIRGSNLTDTLQRIQQEVPASPHRERPGVSRDLASICLRCLEKDPALRYPSAQEVANELQRFLDHQPILARPVGPAGRFVRWCRRSPVVAGLGIAAAALLIAVVVVSVVFAIQVGDRNERIQNQVATLKQQAVDIKKARDDAIDSADAAVDAADEAEVVLSFFVDDVLGGVTRHWERQGTMMTVADALDLAEDKITERFQGKPRAEGWTRYRFAVLYRQFGMLEQSRLMTERGLDLSAETNDLLLVLLLKHQLGVVKFLSGDREEAELLYDAALSELRARRAELLAGKYAYEVGPLEYGLMKDYGMVLVASDRSEEAMPMLNRVVREGPASMKLGAGRELSEALARTGQAKKSVRLLETLYGVCQREFGDDGVQTLGVASELGERLVEVDRHEDAIKLLDEIYARQVEKSSPSNHSAMMTLCRRAEARAHLGRHAEVVQMLEERRDIIEARYPTGGHQYWQLRYALGRSLAQVDRKEEAVEHFRGAVDYWRKQDWAMRLDRSRALRLLLQELAALGRHDELRAICVEEVKNVGDDPHWPHVAEMGVAAAVLLEGARRFDDGLAVVQAARAYEERANGMGEGLVSLLMAETSLHDAARQPERTLPLIAEQLKKWSDLRTQSPLRYCDLRQRQGVGLYRLGRYGEAIPVFEEELQIREREQGKAADDTLQARLNLAVNCEASGKRARAAKLMRDGVEIGKDVTGPAREQVREFHGRLARLYEMARHYAKAEPHLRWVVADSRRGDDVVSLAGWLRNLAVVLRHQGKAEEAEVPARESYELFHKATPDAVDTARGAAILGEILSKLGRTEDAEPLLIAAVRRLAAIERPGASLGGFEQAVVEWLASNYERRKQPEAAAKVRRAYAARRKQ